MGCLEHRDRRYHTMFETSKALLRRLHDSRYATRYFVGHGVDIGAGPDNLAQYAEQFPLMRSCRAWDMPDGDAQLLSTIADATLDFAHSSHCLEHMRDPREALENWARVVKPGGSVSAYATDEDLYEHGQWPTQFNTDHKHTYALAKRESWSPVSRNIDDLLKSLGGEVIKMERIEENFIFGAPIQIDQTSASIAECCIECIVRKPI